MTKETKCPCTRICHSVKLEMIVWTIIILIKQSDSRFQENPSDLSIVLIWIIDIKPFISKHITILDNSAEYT